MWTRRSLLRSSFAAGGLLATGSALGVGPAARPARAERVEPLLNDDGLYTQPWFLQSFLDLGEDLAEAAGNGKRLAVIWEQKGCPYCKEMHLVNFADPEINSYVRENFEVLQLNIHGLRETVDFDGEVLDERSMARALGHPLHADRPLLPRGPGRGRGQRWGSRRRSRACRVTSSRRTSWRCSASCARRPTRARISAAS